jgi:hypothetical protein
MLVSHFLHILLYQHNAEFSAFSIKKKENVRVQKNAENSKKTRLVCVLHGIIKK